MELRFRHDGEILRVAPSDPLPVYIPESMVAEGLPPVAGRQLWSQVPIPGIGAGAAYADGDAFGTLIEFPNVFRQITRTGILHTARFVDLSDQGLEIDLHLYRRRIPGGTDNGAYSPIDADVAYSYLGSIPFTTFNNWGANQASVVAGIGLLVCGDTTSLFGQCTARGAPTVTAGQMPIIEIVLLPD